MTRWNKTTASYDHYRKLAGTNKTMSHQQTFLKVSPPHNTTLKLLAQMWNEIMPLSPLEMKRYMLRNNSFLIQQVGNWNVMTQLERTLFHQLHAVIIIIFFFLWCCVRLIHFHVAFFTRTVKQVVLAARQTTTNMLNKQHKSQTAYNVCYLCPTQSLRH